MINVDMDKAREIKKDMLREERKPLLEALDVKFMLAIEAGDTDAQDAISAKKQALRDITDSPEIANATTPDELRAVRLTILMETE